MSYGHSEAILHAVRREPLAMFHVLRDVKFKDPVVRYYNNDLLHHKQFRFYASNDPPDKLAYTERTNTEKADNDPLLMARYVAPFRKSWIPSLHTVSRSFYAVEEYHIPLPTDVVFLKALYELSIQVDSADLFDNDVIQIIIQYAWTMYGYPYHYFLSILYLVLLSLVTLTNYTFHSWIHTNNYFTPILTIVSIIFFITSYFVILELFQLIQATRDQSLINYLLDVQNLLDWSTYILVYTGYIYRVSKQAETYESASIMSVTTVLMFLKLLYFLRPFKSTGPLIRMVFCILFSIKELMVILVLVIFGFSQAFYLLTFDNDLLDFSSPTDAIINAFLYMMGQSQLSQMQQATNPKLAQFLLCLFIFISAILLLNLLIALMNNSYSAIQAKEVAEWHRECTKIMIEQWRPYSSYTAKHAYYLVRQDDRKNKQKEKQLLPENRMDKIESVLEKVLDAVKRTMDSKIESVDARLVALESSVKELRNSFAKS